ncbi:MAG TPA: sigma-70 family RNA polymerase sigma factor [Actinomycetota bacterium]|nr:sigma-70 family RNA polymerase sigma factor [Actinomycetota bacterium]
MSGELAYPSSVPSVTEADAEATAKETARVEETFELVTRAKTGDQTAFAALYRMHVQSVYRYLAYRLRDNSTAEDLTAEVFVRALRKIGDFEWRGIDFSAWLLRIARNILLDHVKSSGTRLEVVGISPGDVKEGSSPGSDLEVLDRLDREDLHKALNKLRPEHQEVLYLRFLQGLSALETAQAMGKSEGAVRVLQFRALKHLVKIMQQGQEDAG